MKQLPRTWALQMPRGGQAGGSGCQDTSAPGSWSWAAQRRPHSSVPWWAARTAARIPEGPELFHQPWAVGVHPRLMPPWEISPPAAWGGTEDLLLHAAKVEEPK